MAEQKGLIKISGKLGNQIFYEANGKSLVKNAAEKEHSLSEDTKKTASEFAKLIRVAALLNAILKQYCSAYRDSKVYYRLYKLLPKVTGATKTISKGNRTFATGKLSLLKGFQLNAITSTEKLLKIIPQIQIQPNLQQIAIDLPQLDSKSFNVPEHTISLILEFVGYAIDFEKETYNVVQTDELVFNITENEHQACGVTLEMEMDNRVLLVVMGIKLVLQSNAGPYNSRDKKYFAGSFQELAFIKDGNIVPFIEPEVNISPVEMPNPMIKAKWVKKDFT